MCNPFRGLIANAIGAVAFATLATGAQASFHLYQISQIYSDASGNVQYIEFASEFAGQEFVQNVHLVASLNGSSHDFVFPSNLPATMAHTTENTKFLVATQCFASLGIVTPDYVVPDKFLFIPGGSIAYSFVDAVTYPTLPTTGNQAINRFGATVPAAPSNFAGNSAMVNVTPPTPAGVYDIDGNGHVDPLTDGLLLMRYLFNLRGTALTQGAVGTCAVRSTPEEIQAHIAAQIP